MFFPQKCLSPVNNLGQFLSNRISAIINKIRSLFAQSGNNTSGFDSLMRELEHDKNNAAIANNQTQ
ncbi:MAG: hypothetical protein V7K89_24940 [Nostoc sp.]|uniref:hypothetical protein n=1 Tax=Nostoc sp. TaxID=1180 RepID=UPI002FF5DA8E